MKNLSLLVLAAPLLAACGGSHAADLAATEDGFALTEESPFVQVFRPGERERLLYVWTRDATGEASDLIAVVDADPRSTSYGQIVSTAPTGSTNNEAHHFSYTADAGRIFAAGMFTNRIFIYDVASDPRTPRLLRAVELDGTGYNGPHTPYAIPGGVLVAMMGQPDGGSGGLVRLDEDGGFVGAYPASGQRGQPVHLYDVVVDPASNRMMATAFTHVEHLRHGVPDLAHTGTEIVVWDWETAEIVQVAEVDPAPAVLRWLRTPGARAGFVPTVFGGSVWFWEDANGDGTFEFQRVLQLADGSLPVDLRISHDDRYMFVSLWGGGKVQQYDIADPRNPRLVDQIEVPQPNMIRLSPDSERLYVTNSITSVLDGDVEFGAWLFHVGPNGMQRDERFTPDFQNFAAGRAGPHDMLLR